MVQDFLAPGRAMERFKQRARNLRSAQTGAEAVLWRALRGRRLEQWKFRRQHPVGRYVADFASVEGKLIVEVDGATHSTVEELTRDAKRTCALEAAGYLVVRVTNTDVYENLEGVLEMIARTLRPQDMP